jgi:hypothetical protein
MNNLPLESLEYLEMGEKWQTILDELTMRGLFWGDFGIASPEPKANPEAE